eukprot:1156469-Pelagomonas_calceolata.AAC.8
MDCPMQTVHLYLLKRILGVKRTTPNWSVLSECGFEPLQLYWFRSAVRFYHASLACNSITLRKVIAADVGMRLDRRNSFAQCVYSGQPIKDFVVDLKKRHRSVWPTEDQAEHDGHPNKIANYHNWVALPFVMTIIDVHPALCIENLIE